jgi:hypothetical protein
MLLSENVTDNGAIPVVVDAAKEATGSTGLGETII